VASAYGWQPYYLQVPIVLKSGSLNLLEPSGPVQACNGIALSLFWRKQLPPSSGNESSALMTEARHIIHIRGPIYKLHSITTQKAVLFVTVLPHKKLKCTLVQALRLCTDCTVHRRGRGIALLFLDHSTRRGWGVSAIPWPLFTPGKDPVPIVWEAGWAPGLVWNRCGKSRPPHRDSIPRPSSP